MIRKHSIFAILLLIHFAAFSQWDETYKIGQNGRTRITDSTVTPIMVVPLSPMMYYSYYDKQMVDENVMDVKRLRDTIRLVLAMKVAEVFDDSVTTRVIPEALTGNEADLKPLYNAISFTHPEVPPVKTEEKKPVFKKSKKKSKNEKPKGTYIENGQIISIPDYTEHYTNAVVKDTDLLALVHHRNKTNIYVLINKYEMTMPDEVRQVDIQSGNFPREIKVSYTIVTYLGKELDSGLIKVDVTSFDDRLDTLFGYPFEFIGSEIFRRFKEKTGN